MATSRKTFEDYYRYRIQEEPPADMYELGLQVATWMLSWITTAATLLDGKQVVETTKEKAMRRLVPLLEKAYGKKFPPPPRKQKPEDRCYRLVRPEAGDAVAHDDAVQPNSKGEKAMKENGKKTGGKKAAPAKQAAATATVVDGEEVTLVRQPAKKRQSVTAQKKAAKKAAPKPEAEKPEAKAKAKAKAKAAVAGEQRRADDDNPRMTRFRDDQKITLLVKENPKRKGTAQHIYYGYYKECKTVGDFVKRGGSYAGLRRDANAGYIEVK